MATPSATAPAAGSGADPPARSPVHSVSGDRQFVDILTAVAEAGPDAVEAGLAPMRAVGQAVRPRRRAEHPWPDSAMPHRYVRWRPQPHWRAVDRTGGRDCARYDRLRHPSLCEEAHRGAAWRLWSYCGQLKLAGMRAAYDEVRGFRGGSARAALNFQRIFGELLLAQIGRSSRPIDRLPHRGGAFPGDEEPRRVRLHGLGRSTRGWCASCTRAAFSPSGATPNAGRRDRHRQEPHRHSDRRQLRAQWRPPMRFFTAVDLVNQLEEGRAARRQSRKTRRPSSSRVDLVILDELGYLPFPGQRRADAVPPDQPALRAHLDRPVDQSRLYGNGQASSPTRR